MDFERYARWIDARLISCRSALVVYEQDRPIPNFIKYDFTPDLVLSGAKCEKFVNIFASSDEDGRCLFLDLDLDNKNDNPQTQSKNEKLVAAICQRASAYQPLVIRNKLTGSFHILILFATPQRIEQVVALGRAIIERDRAIMIFPCGVFDKYPRKASTFRIPGPHLNGTDVAGVWDDQTQTYIDWGTDAFLEVLERFQGVSGDDLPAAEDWPDGQIRRRPERYGPPPPRTPCNGPGTELRKLIGSLGLKSTDIIGDDGCGGSCQEWVDKMNRWGVEWCREMRPAIIEQMQLQAEKTKAFAKLKAGGMALFSKLPAIGRAVSADSLPLTVDGLVDEAINRAATGSNRGS